MLTTVLNRISTITTAISLAVGAAALSWLAWTEHVRLEMVRQQTESAAFAQLQTFLRDVAHDPELARIYSEGKKDPGSLTEVEQVRMTLEMQSLFYSFADIHRSREAGGISDGGWSAIDLVIRSQLKNPLFADFWNKRKSTLPVDFQHYVDGEDMKNAPRR